MYSKSVCEGKCTGVLHLQGNVRFLIFKKTGDRPLSCVFLFLRKQGTEPVPVSAYVGSSKNLKDLKGTDRFRAFS